MSIWHIASQERSGINRELNREELQEYSEKSEKTLFNTTNSAEWEQRNFKDGSEVEKLAFATCVVDRAGVI